MTARRLQATIFLPEPAGSAVQAVRLRYDPVMATRVASHVTVVYEVPDQSLLAERLAAACATTPPFPLRVEGPQCWDGEPDGGIHLPVEDPDGVITRLRSAVIRPPFAEPATLVYQPHVTLVHPRTTTVEGRHRAWSERDTWKLPSQPFLIDRVTVIGEFDHDWTVVKSYRLGQDSRS